VREPKVCEDEKDETPRAEERPPSKDVTKQRSEDRDWEHKSVCDSDSCSVVRSLESVAHEP
jgi:hypothetical protein